MDQTIFDELVSYRDTGKILGNHPIFAAYSLQKTVDEMSIAQASNRKSNLENYIRRDIKNIENSKTPEDKSRYQQKVDSWKEELELIKTKLASVDAQNKYFELPVEDSEAFENNASELFISRYLNRHYQKLKIYRKTY